MNAFFETRRRDHCLVAAEGRLRELSNAVLSLFIVVQSKDSSDARPKLIYETINTLLPLYICDLEPPFCPGVL